MLLRKISAQLTGEQARTTRTYRKRNDDYWSSEIIEARSKRRQVLLSSCTEYNSSNILDVQSLLILEIKEKLKELGVQTRVRKLDKLRDILQKALEV